MNFPTCDIGPSVPTLSHKLKMGRRPSAPKAPLGRWLWGSAVSQPRHTPRCLSLPNPFISQPVFHTETPIVIQAALGTVSGSEALQMRSSFFLWFPLPPALH
ncbi:hypothetical protein H8959_001676 [Pygathrix nigripes]